MASYIDFRYPGAFNLNQQATLPKIAVPDVASMFQTGLSAIADPIAARLKEDTTRARTAQEAAQQMNLWDQIYKIQAGQGQTTTATPAEPAAAPRNPNVAGSPAGDDTGGVQGGGGGRMATPKVQTDPVTASQLKPYEAALLNGITNSESPGGAYNIRYAPGGGKPFEETGEHPRIPEPTAAGKKSTAAGRYQFTATTWDAITGGNVPFTRENQDIYALKLARQDYAQRTGSDLDADLQREGFSPRIQQVLAPTWEGLHGSTASNAAAYNRTLARFSDPERAPKTAFAPEVSPDVTPAASGTVTLPDGTRYNADEARARAQGQAAPVAPQARAAAPEVPVRMVPTTRERPIEYEDAPPAPQAAAPQQAPVQEASLNPRISPAVPGLTLTDAVPLPPRRPPELTPAPQAPPTPAEQPPAAAPRAAPAGSTRPPASPAGVPPEAPVRVAQAQPQGLPAQVEDRTSQRIDPRAAALMLRTARTPEEVNKIGQALLSTLLPPEAKKRFDFSSDGKGNAWIVDTFTGKTTPLTGATPQVDEKKTTLERNLFNDFESTQTVKDYRNLEQGVQGLRAAFSEGHMIADHVAIVQLFKTIDPTSTVTGNESASLRNAAGVPETLRALYNRGFEAGGQFSPKLRAEIFNTAQRIQQNRQAQVEQQAGVYRGRARRYGLDEENVVSIQPFKFERATPETFPDQPGSQDQGGGGAVPGVSRPGSSRANPIDVPNEAAATRLPRGTFFRLNGRVGINE